MVFPGQGFGDPADLVALGEADPEIVVFTDRETRRARQSTLRSHSHHGSLSPSRPVAVLVIDAAATRSDPACHTSQGLDPSVRGSKTGAPPRPLPKLRKFRSPRAHPSLSVRRHQGGRGASSGRRGERRQTQRPHARPQATSNEPSKFNVRHNLINTAKRQFYVGDVIKS